MGAGWGGCSRPGQGRTSPARASLREQVALHPLVQRAQVEPRLGLGLALSKGFTEGMGGTLDTEDTPGGGLTMVVTLPLAPPPTAPAPAPTRTPPLREGDR